ncbi:MAG: hypothetical protein ABID61_05530, partial [Candidatus Micrarchaeota archaeon]
MKHPTNFISTITNEFQLVDQRIATYEKNTPVRRECSSTSKYTDFKIPIIFQQLNLDSLLEKYQQEEIECGLVLLFLRNNSLKTDNGL